MLSILDLFSKKSAQTKFKNYSADFGYLEEGSYYFDSACQALRPECVIQAEVEYYHRYNSCGHRVKYPWGVITDQKIAECRTNLLEMVGKKAADHVVAFNLNTTAAINTVLMQISPYKFKSIITSEIEHNSVFLPSMAYSQKYSLPRKVLSRHRDGSLDFTPADLDHAIVLLNSTSNIDGRELLNLKELSEVVHKQGGILLLDACQTFAHNIGLLKEVEIDAIFGAGHKMYGPSLGFTIIKKQLLLALDCFLIGGSTVESVSLDSKALIGNEDELYARIEPGLQNYAGIVGLNQAIKWFKSFERNYSDLEDELLGLRSDFKPTKQPNKRVLNAYEYEQILSEFLAYRLNSLVGINFVNRVGHSPIVSFYCTKNGLDSHKLAAYLSEAGIMLRSGYHCCHYYLKEKLNLPPLLRISLGLHNTFSQIDYLVTKLKFLTEKL